MKKLLLSALTLTVITLTGCSTVDGVAEDLGVRDAEVNQLTLEIESLKTEISVLNSEIDVLDDLLLEGRITAIHHKYEVEKLKNEIGLLEEELSEYTQGDSNETI